MNALHIGTELRRFGHGKLPRLAAVIIMLMPLLFGGLFVWSYWDPIGRLKDFPVALVNSDEGVDLPAEKPGEAPQHLNAGEEVSKKLLESGAVKFEQLSADEARQGVADGTYYFAIELPGDFSESVASVKGDHPHQATLNAVYNNDNGLIATTLGNQVVSRVLAQVNSALGEKVTDNLLLGFSSVHDSVGKAAEGANSLADGAGKAKEGSSKLASGAGELDNGAQQLSQGAAALSEGAGKLDEGVGKAASAGDQLASGLAALNSATARLGDGASQVSAGVDTIADKAAQVTAAQEQLTGPLVNLSAQLRATGMPPAIEMAGQIDNTVTQLNSQGLGSDSKMAQDISRLSAGAAEIARQLSDPAAEYAAGMAKATDGAAQLSTGLHQLKDGSSQLVVGANKLADGSSRLAAGTSQLTVGARALEEGLVKLDDGSGELALKLDAGAKKIPHYEDATRGDYAKAMATPATVSQPNDSLSLFGEGLAPIFISLGLFMGATVTFMVMRPLQRRAVESGMASPRVVLASYVPAVIFGLSQATIMFAVQRYMLGLRADNELGLWLAMCLTAAVFQMIVLGINTVVGASAGRVICIALMTLQIVSSGGLYPAEVQPRFMQWFHHYDPMTYSVNILRQFIFHTSPDIDPRLWGGVATLALIWVIFATLAGLGARAGRRLVLKDLHPELAL